MSDASQILEELKASILFAADFPRRDNSAPRYVPEQTAATLVREEWGHLQALVNRLAEACYAPAIPTLAQLWRECALHLVRVAAGHALFKMRTPEALNALEAMIDDNEHVSAFLGVKAVFARDPSKAYDYFRPRFAGGRTNSSVPRIVLGLFSPHAWALDGTPRWDEDGRDWLKQDSRWLLLCARLRRHREWGDGARMVLRHAPPPHRIAAMESVRREEAKRSSSPPSTSRNGNLLARYTRGDFENVWREIRSHSKIGGDFRAEIVEVAEAAMRRVARNADLLAARLQDRGWRALFAKDRLRIEPTPADEEIFRSIERITECPVPPSLLAFWRVVGGIDFIWDYECGIPLPIFAQEFPLDEMDPLCIAWPEVVASEAELWENQKSSECDPDLVDPLRLNLSPDYACKFNASGPGPYEVELPFWGADPIFKGEKHELPLIDYLRMSFRWAGFPRLQYHSDRSTAMRFVAQLGSGLEPF